MLGDWTGGTDVDCRPPRGGRGLKCYVSFLLFGGRGSPSSRRAWIEIRRLWFATRALPCRPPRGGRGLKYIETSLHRPFVQVALLAEGVD